MKVDLHDILAGEAVRSGKKTASAVSRISPEASRTEHRRKVRGSVGRGEAGESAGDPEGVRPGEAHDGDGARTPGRGGRDDRRVFADQRGNSWGTPERRTGEPSVAVPWNGSPTPSRSLPPPPCGCTSSAARWRGRCSPARDHELVGKLQNMKVKMMGMNSIIFCCAGSIPADGVIFCWTNMETPIRRGRSRSAPCTPRRRSPEVLGGGEIVHPEEERRVPQLDRDQQPLVEGDEHRDLRQHRQAPGEVHLLYVLYRFIVSWLRRCASPLYFSFSVLRIGPSSCIFLMEAIDFCVRGKKRILIRMVRRMMSMPELLTGCSPSSRKTSGLATTANQPKSISSGRSFPVDSSRAVRSGWRTLSHRRGACRPAAGSPPCRPPPRGCRSPRPATRA